MNAEAKLKPDRENSLKYFVERFEKSFPLRTLVFFLLLFLLNGGGLRQPPYWDSAASIFSAAGFLADNHFNYAELLAAAGYSDGGPNEHSLTMLVPLMASLFLIFSPENTYLLLHLLHFLFAACVVAQIFSISRQHLSLAPAGLFSLVFLLYPLFLTQSRLMYLELPLLLCTLCAMRWCATRADGLAWAMILPALLCKESALILVPAFLGYGLTRPAERRPSPTLMLLATSLLLLAFWGMNSLEGPSTFRANALAEDGMVYSSFGVALITLFAWLLNNLVFLFLDVPDLAILFVVGLALSFWRVIKSTFSLRLKDKDRQSAEDELLDVSAFVVFAFFLTFFFMLPLSQHEPNLLSRYYLQILPALLFLFLPLLKNSLGERGQMGVALLLLFLCGFNQNGALYAPTHDEYGLGRPALMERSGEYKEHQMVLVEGIKRLELLDEGNRIIFQPVFTQHLTQVKLGYVQRALKNIEAFSAERHHNLESLPECVVFFMAFNNAEAQSMREILRDLGEDSRWLDRGSDFIEVNDTKVYLFRFSRAAANCRF
ncbi:MAG: hypothetical protein QGI45_02520 [Myxococcota bacterium]|nr:hypothetical protein [Myxococcota bacterium]